MKISRFRMDVQNGRIDNSFLRGYGETLVGGSGGTNAGSTYTVDLSTGNVFYLILNSASCTFTFPSTTSAISFSFTLILKQDATAGRTATWPGSVKWPGGIAPVLSTLPYGINIFSFFTPDGGTTWLSIHPGTEHFASNMMLWGTDPFGAQGNNSVSPGLSSPIMVGANKLWSVVGSNVNSGSSGGIANGNQLWMWGRNQYGQLGNNSSTGTSSPIQVLSSQAWSTISVGYQFTIGLTKTNQIWVWGRDLFGQLANNIAVGGLVMRSSPIQIAADKSWASVTAGSSHVAALTTSGQIWTWGGNAAGQLGDNTSASKSSPVQIASDKSWASVIVGNVHTLAMTTANELWVWGSNTFGQLGDSTIVSKSSPIQIASDKSWASVWAGTSTFQTFAITTTNQLWTWGAGTQGQLGDNTNVSKSSPIQIASDKSWASATAGSGCAFAITTTGQLWGWGGNSSGQLADNTTVASRSSPIQIAALVSWQSVAASTIVMGIASKGIA